MDVLVVGGTGVISRAIVKHLLGQGHRVSVFNRGQREAVEGVRQLTGDRRQVEAFETLMRDQRYDAVIDMICYTEADAQVTLRAFGGRTGHLVVCSTTAVYQRPFAAIPCTEASERLWTTPAFPYGFEKAKMERFLQPPQGPPDEARGTPITVIRPSLTFGEGSANVGVLRQNKTLVDRIRRGRPVISFGDGKAPWSFTFASDLARGFVLALGRPSTYGRAYHVTSEERHVWDDLYRALGRAVGVEPIIRHLPAELLVKASSALFDHIHVEKSWPGVFDCSRFRADVPDFETAVSLDAGTAALVQWFDAATQPDPAKDALEDQLVALWDCWSQEIAALTPSPV